MISTSITVPTTLAIIGAISASVFQNEGAPESAPEALEALKAPEASVVSWEPMAPKLVHSNADAVGAFLWANDVRYRIHYLEWGIHATGKIGYATLLAEGEDGSFIDYHTPEAFLRIVTDPAELVGMIMTDGSTGEGYRLESIQYAVHADGHLGAFSWSGTSADGRFVSSNVGASFNDEGPPCCGLRSTTNCNSNNCNAPNLCPGPTDCVCRTPAGGLANGGSCFLSDEQICSGNCGKKCKQIEGTCNGSVAACACEAPGGGGGGGGGGDGDGGE